jgi:hypothetical protein
MHKRGSIMAQRDYEISRTDERVKFFIEMAEMARDISTRLPDNILERVVVTVTHKELEDLLDVYLHRDTYTYVGFSKDGKRPISFKLSGIQVVALD